jgi:hypothetical protein
MLWRLPGANPVCTVVVYGSHLLLATLCTQIPKSCIALTWQEILEGFRRTPPAVS